MTNGKVLGGAKLLTTCCQKSDSQPNSEAERGNKCWAGSPNTQKGFRPDLGMVKAISWGSQGRTSPRAAKDWTQQAMMAGNACTGERGILLTVQHAAGYHAALGYCIHYSWESYDAVIGPCCLMQLQVPYILH